MTALFSFRLSVPTIKNLRARKALRRLDLIVQQIVSQEADQRGNDSHDLLSLLRTLRNGSPRNGAGWKLVRDEVMTFLLAGHETTAATLAWTWYALAQHACVESRLHQELEELLAGRDPSLSDLPRLTYTRMIIDEVMRLYAPVWLIPRRSIGDDRIGGYRIPANSDVLLSVYMMHRHPDFWDSSEKFDPERFSREECAQRAASCYLPFGAGARACIGSRFGLMETILVVAVRAQRLRFELVSGCNVAPEASLTLSPRNGIHMRLRALG